MQEWFHVYRSQGKASESPTIFYEKNNKKAIKDDQKLQFNKKIYEKL